MVDAFDRITGKDSAKGDAFDRFEQPEETYGRSALRTALQIPKGIAQGTGYGILTNLMNLISSGEAFDEEEIERIRNISEREGIPFDEEKYREATKNALETFPTISNIARGIENYTDLPLESKNKLQKFIEFASTAGKIAPKGSTFKGLNTSLPRPLLGTGVAGASEAIKQIPGIPEPLAEALSFAVLKQPTAGAGKISFGKEKPSGMVERQFEKIKKPRKVTQKKLGKINTKLEKDFRDISNKIIKDAPVGKTFDELRTNPTFKQDTRELLSEAEKIADSIPGNYSTDILKKEINSIYTTKKETGFAPNEYDKFYAKYMKELIKETPKGKVKAGDFVRQYRKNNHELTEYFEPGSSRAVNRAKRDAILDHNRAIAKAMEKTFPDSELIPVFKEGNERWSKIMDAEAVDDFVEKIFTGEKINYKDIHKYFDKEGYSRIFKRALGDKGTKDFEQLLKDMLSSETAYKNLNLAKSMGFTDLFQAAVPYVINPILGKTFTAGKIAKNAWKWALNSTLDKPQISITWKKGIDNLKTGNFKEATKNFQSLQKELTHAEKKEIATKKNLEKMREIETSRKNK